MIVRNEATAWPYLLLTLSALFWAGNAVLARALHNLMPPATMAFWRWVLALLLRWRPAGIGTMAFFGAAVVGGIVLLMLPLYLAELASGRVAVWNAATGAGTVYFAVFPSILAYLFWNRGVQQVGANRAGLFLYLVPVFGIGPGGPLG